MLKYNNGQIEFVHSDSSAAMDRLYRGFAKNRDWLEAIRSYIRLCGDTSLDDLKANLSYILNIDIDLTGVYIDLSVSKLKILGDIKAINNIIQCGGGYLCLSERSMNDILSAIANVRKYGSLSESYYVNLILDIQSGRVYDSTIAIDSTDKDIANRTLKMLLTKGYLTRRDKVVYPTQSLNDWAESHC